jgi:uncharacterized protein YdaU (DUF1376 family)
MARFSPIRVNYVAFYFKDWLPALYTMSTVESGIYIRLVVHLYEAGGRLENKTPLLATISGLSELEFSTHWLKLKSKFVQEGNYITHKRCLIELRRAKRMTDAARKGGVNSAKSRAYGKSINSKENSSGLEGRCNHPSTKDETRTRQEENRTNTSTINPIFQKTLDNMKVSDSFSKSFSLSDSTRSPQADSSREGDKLVLYGALQDFFNIRSNADRTALDNICKWAVNHPQAGHASGLASSKDFYRKVIDLADESKKKAKTNRWGYFFDVLRRQLGYVPGKTDN